MIRHIEYLIIRHDCVVIPGFGALIAHYRPAYIDRELGCMFPPSRTLVFNPDIIHNDGLLASSIARSMETTFDSASALLSKEVTALKLQLDNSGEFALGRLGIFSRKDNGPVVFEPFQATALSPRLAGMRAIAMQPVTEVIAEEAGNLTAEKEGKSHMPLRRRVINVAASLALLVCLGVTLTTPIFEHKASLAGFGSSIVSTAKMEETEFESIMQPDIDLRIALPMKTAETEEPRVIAVDTKADTTIPTATPRIIAADKYYLIVASLPSREKAEEFISMQNHGDKLEIAEADGRYRVYAATGNTIAEARQPLISGEFGSRYPDAWVCCK